VRWFAIAVAVLLAAGLGLLAGYTRWGTQVPQTERVEQRLQTTDSELLTLRQQKEELEQRLQQVNKEQERLAQENEILRQQRTTEQLLGGAGGELPARPPK
jgi:uncharacterized protein HemX